LFIAHRLSFIVLLINDYLGLIFGLSVLSASIWLFLICFWGFFWKTDQQLDLKAEKLEKHPSVCVVIPARNEAECLSTTLSSILAQDYPGCLSVILVDDRSTDDTVKTALETYQKSLSLDCAANNVLGDRQRGFKLLTAEPLPLGWTGKLWALEQGIRYAEKEITDIDYFLFTDADIQHEISNLQQLVTKAEGESLDLVSLMVLLRCESFWEQLLIPAFVFFFQKLYPFRWVNDRDRTMAAAAGGCILIRKATLNRIGGIETISKALIDDCALGQAVKASKGNIWLGLTSNTKSLRVYPSLKSIWDMVARTAYTQLQYSPRLAIGTILGMTLVYLVPPLASILGIAIASKSIAIAGLIGWLLMSFAYLPTILFYKRSPLLSLCLPLIALLYTLMTLDSALRHYQGKGGEWKGRVYQKVRSNE
jgi:hopene-associated glycosyltransferase HpnB